MKKNDSQMMFELPAIGVDSVPEVLRAGLEDSWHNFVVTAKEAGVAPPLNRDLLNVLCKVWACSEFVARACVRNPEMWAGLVRSGDLMADYHPQRYLRELRASLADIKTEDALGVVLRQFRRREMVRIAWRDIAAWADLDETLKDLSRLASACTEMALECLHQRQSKELGVPYGEQSGQPQSMVVLGMGKLGADELNFSSDIDLIFAYPEDGETRGVRLPLSNEEYFTRLGRSLIAALNNQTEDGYVFRVDMRLRPFGDAGPLAVSFDAMENYYQVHGREWERYALIKAAIIAGDRKAGEGLFDILRPFVYRRYLDYGAFESLREMKAMIAREVKRKGMVDNVKLGPGGIREVEFTGQAYQLIRGGRDRDLQVRPILKVLQLLAEKDYMPEYVVKALTTAYIFLRRAENRLQAIADQQTHSLPSNEADRQRLALAMNYKSWPTFEKDLRRHMAVVHDHFEQVFAAPQREQAAEQGSVYDDVWCYPAGGAEVLQQQGYDQPEEAVRLLERLREGFAYRAMRAQGRERLDRLMPLLLGAVAAVEQPTETLDRVVGLIEGIARRTAYLALLVENPMALSQLVRLCAASSWIAVYLARHPILLDELLDARSLYVPLARADLEMELKSSLAQVGDDFEQQVDVLRHFKQANVLRVAAADVMGAFPLMVVSDHLTEIAEVVLEQAVNLAHDYLLAKHGSPLCMGEDGRQYVPGFLVIAYGKLGGIELSYGSDLDLVFLHGNYACGGQTDGESGTDNVVFFVRLGQRVIHIITALTPAGVLYEVDSRLRPNGDAGILVADMNTFAVYQAENAWTWEHQALVRARVVTGDAKLAKRFDIIRAKALGVKRDSQQLQHDVREMRQKMRNSLSKAKVGEFDLKQSEGGIADIEFMVQYAVLRWSHDHPRLLTWTDNVRLLGTLAEEGLFTQEDADLLADAYRAYRAAVHRAALQGLGVVVAETEFVDFRQAVKRLWHDLLEKVE